ncbi:DUF3788 domain-containing protein [Methanocorpusculum sp. MG]|uniref:DUF3788 domain-containing protein n=1 Tax=Methanocorpusculum petauri TaxID=3002863 RepID=A0ABT4IGF6_9EURY|nr:DUF3788 domain-containing protein [Methanocorpusculum petauri]MCZ0860265.1 DUF3788 domain-containing protein [Methanocorpusculum petauri]MDE2443671.1 DUF3788 domain-containing protein [Methanocorpusculum sp.]
MAVLQEIPTENEITSLIGAGAFSYWEKICLEINLLYDMDKIWSDGGKKWKYEYKYRRGGKTLCALYARQDCFGFMIIFGKDERKKVENIRNDLSARTMELYDTAEIYHDGKWVMLNESVPIDDILMLLKIKRKPNRTFAK